MLRSWLATLLIGTSVVVAQSPATKQLSEAIKHNDVSAVRQALAQGADVNYGPKGAPTLLADAAYSRNPEIMRAMLDRNPSRALMNETLSVVAEVGSGPAIMEGPSEADNDAQEPPHFSEFDAPAAEMMEMLLRAGADPNFHDVYGGSTALQEAAGEGAAEVVEVLLRHGAKVNDRDSKGNTALMLAACECLVATPPDASRVLKVLLEHGAALNLQNSHGRTALMLAAEHGTAIAAKILLQHGANPDVSTKSGETALSLAKQEGQHRIVRMLEAYKR